VIRRQCERGRSVFDLGVGEARYKRTFCDEVDELVDLVVPATATGQVYAALTGAVIGAKRRLKASPRAMRVIGMMRRMRSAAPTSD
jgi:CelD/BcsL family acetyltransferase involved in cellulose biosynthesis